MDWWILALVWAVCGVIAAGLSFAVSQRHFWENRRAWFVRDQKMATTMMMGGPCSLVAMLLILAQRPDLGLVRHGWLWPWGARARREAGL